MTKTLHILARQALWKRYREVTGCDTDAKGYVDSIENNLLPGITPDMFESGLASGSGNEMESKFKAVHSSSALTVNTFTPFKKDPGKLVLAGKTGFTTIQFEKQ